MKNFSYHYLQFLMLLALSSSLLSQSSTAEPFNMRSQFGFSGTIEFKNFRHTLLDTHSTPIFYQGTFISLGYIAPYRMVKFEAIGFDGVSMDPYNGLKPNYSLLSLFNLVWWNLGAKDTSQSITDQWKNPYIIAANLLNSTHYFLFSKPKFTHDVSLSGLFTLGAYLKNHAQLYLFRRQKWLRFSPGAGLAIITGSVLLEFGFSESIDFTGSGIKTTPHFHLGFVLTGEMQ